MLFRTGELKLYAVVVGGVYPLQCVTVMDHKPKAEKLADHLNKTVRGVVEVQEVNSFFPSHMVDADQVWLDAATAYQQSDKQD